MKIDSTILELLVVLGDGPSEKYFLTTHICTDEYEEKLSEAWLRGESDSLPYGTFGDYQTEDCTRTSPQDSTIITKSNLPQIVKLDVTNLTRELIEFGSIGVIYVITAVPLDEELTESSKTPSRELGILGLASNGSDRLYGGNVMANLAITYTSTPTSTVEILQNALVIVPPLAVIPISIFLYWHGQTQSHSNLIRRNARSLRIEINENSAALSGEREYQIIERDSEDDGDLHIRYTNCFLDDDAYTSILTSGEFTRLEVQTQTVLRELYTRIRDHNEQIKYTNELEDHFSIQPNNETDLENLTERYEVNITILEEVIVELIPQAIFELNLEIDIQSSRFSFRRFLPFS